jgi:hypothetical protein
MYVREADLAAFFGGSCFFLTATIAPITQRQVSDPPGDDKQQPKGDQHQRAKNSGFHNLSKSHLKSCKL